MLGRWLRSLWRQRTGRGPAPLVGEIVAEPVTPQADPTPPVVDGEVVDTPDPTSRPVLTMPPDRTTVPDEASSQPGDVAPPSERQPHLAAQPGNTIEIIKEKKVMSNPFEQVIEALGNVSFVPESGQDAEDAIDGSVAAITALGQAIAAVAESIGDTLPQADDSREHLAGLAEVVSGIGSHAAEQAQAWRDTAAWVWQGNS